MLSNVQKELNRFAKYVVSQSKANLTRGKKKSSRRLYDSIDYDLNVSPNSFSLKFFMEEYGKFQDKGVSGTRKKYNTPYSYKDKMPPSKKLDKWLVKRNLKGIRNEKGQFISRKSLSYVIARSVFIKGIKPSLFFTKPFEKAFKDLPQDIVKAYALDVEELIKFTTNGNNKR